MYLVGGRNTVSVAADILRALLFLGGNHGRVDTKLATEEERLTMVVVQTYLGRAEELVLAMITPHRMT